MRFLFVIFFFSLTVFVYGEKKKITLSLQDVSVKNALEILQDKTDMSLWFNIEDVDMDKIVSVNVEKGTLNDVLNAILLGQDVFYEIKPDHIIITKKNTENSTLKGMPENIRKVSGKVVDEMGIPMGYVIVRDKQAHQETMTDGDGRFSLSMPSSSKTLVFSYIGMVAKELEPSNGMLVQMAPTDQKIKELVVTALDIKRNKKSLSYSSQSIGEEPIGEGRDLSFTSSLSGMISGINVLLSSSGAGGSTKITLRGTRNITSTNQPLVVIDGVPISNSQTSDSYGFYSGRDSGDGLSNINPDEIASITILKGANAALLYGSQGSNGVILITTKKGIDGVSSISVHSGVSFSNVSEFPALQYTYGQTSSGSEDSWGEKGDYGDFVKNFFRTGVTYQNSISLSSGNDKATTYFSYANVNSVGIMPTNKYVKHNIGLRQTLSFFDKKLVVSSNIMLAVERLHNTFLNGYYWNPLLGLYNFPRGLDFSYYKKNYQLYDSDQGIMVQNWSFKYNEDGEMNPYWILYNDPNQTRTQRFIGDLGMIYDFKNGLKLSARGNLDYTNQLYELKAKASSSTVLVSENGRYIYSNLTSWQSYGDLLLTLNKHLSENFSIHAVLGAAYQKKVLGDGQYIDSNVYGLTTPNVFTLQNISSLSAFTSAQTIQSRLEKQSLFGNLSIGYKGRVYLDLSGRNDWASSLAFTNHLSYYYPSVGFSLILSDIFKLPSFVNFAKFRGSFAQVSNEIPAFVSNVTGSVSANGYSSSFVKAFTDLKPEMSDNYEMGLELQLLKNRLSVDVTSYLINTKNQYLEMEAPTGSGYTYYYVNAGYVRTNGLELTLNAKPLSLANISWESNVNYSNTHNKIITLGDQLSEYYTLPGGGEGYEMEVTKGGSMGDIYTYAYSRDANGNIILDDEHIPVKSTTEKKAGNASPNWMLGWNNEFRFKNIEFGFLIDGKFGGKYISMTQAYLDRNGVTKVTADARDAGGVWVSGVLQDGTSWSGLVDAKAYYTGTAGRGGIMEHYVYDATNVRLQRILLGYNWKFGKGKKSFVKNLLFSVIATDPFYFYKKAPGNPNMTISTGNGTQSVENFGLPLTRSFSFNVKVDM